MATASSASIDRFSLTDPASVSSLKVVQCNLLKKSSVQGVISWRRPSLLCRYDTRQIANLPNQLRPRPRSHSLLFRPCSPRFSKASVNYTTCYRQHSHSLLDYPRPHPLPKSSQPNHPKSTRLCSPRSDALGSLFPPTLTTFSRHTSPAHRISPTRPRPFLAYVEEFESQPQQLPSYINHVRATAGD
ncbi:hypothetical protein BC629DRAFT_477397 [Irpex lacteus]|nr:hypothetical protein BC629DRAFT_477397 [Irpex lacteus]